MTDFNNQNLTGSRFKDVDLTDARFNIVDLSNTRFHEVDLSGASIRGSLLVNVDISGDVENLVVNGVDVAPLVEAELNRRYPDRSKMRPSDADGYREAWDVLERLWQQTVERARGMAPELLHERVDDEWSFIETLRHLVFATDAWVSRAILGEPSPWDPLGLPHTEMSDEPSIPVDLAARPVAGRGARSARGPDGHRASGARRSHRREAGRPDRTSDRAGLPGAGELRRPPLPSGHPLSRSGSTACTPNATSTFSSPDRLTNYRCQSTRHNAASRRNSTAGILTATAIRLADVDGFRDARHVLDWLCPATVARAHDVATRTCRTSGSTTRDHSSRRCGTC